jgi:UPF0042 nucleotide-binding protein
VNQQVVVVVTGLSGAGKSTAVAALEDLGFFCVDNLPTPVIESTLDALSGHGITRAALGIDVRVGAFLDLAPQVVQALITAGTRAVDVLFLDANDATLIRRFGSTRRPHPLSTLAIPGAEREAVAVLDGIRMERVQLAPLRARASIVIDTSDLSIHDLRRMVVDRFGGSISTRARLSIRIVSFGFKYGLPIDADLVFDVRFMRNPYFVEELKDKDGLQPQVRQYVLDTADAEQYLRTVSGLLEFCLPRFESEGKSYLTIAIGCTGGRHRSVAVAEALVRALHKPPEWPVDVIHRDLRKDLEPVADARLAPGAFAMDKESR